MVLLLWLRDEVFDHGVVLHTGRLHRTASAGSLSLALAASRRSSTLASASGASAAASLSRNSVDAVLNELRGVDPLHVRLDAWITAAGKQLQWSRDEARLCFELFCVFAGRGRNGGAADATPEPKAAKAEAGGAVGDADPLATVELPFVEFALFLFVQLYVPVVASSPVRQLSSTLWPSEASPNNNGHGSPSHHAPGGGSGHAASLHGVASAGSPHAHGHGKHGGHHPHLSPASTTGSGAGAAAGHMSSPPPSSPGHGNGGGHSVGSPLSPGASSPRGHAGPHSGMYGAGTGTGRGHGNHGPISPSSPRGLALNTRATEQAHRLQFVKKHIADILQILYHYSSSLNAAGQGGAGAAAAAAGSGSVLSKSALRGLGFLVQCGSSTMSQAVNLAVATPWFADAADGTPAPDTAPVSPGVLADWLLGHLTVNEVLHPAVAQLMPTANALSPSGQQHGAVAAGSVLAPPPPQSLQSVASVPSPPGSPASPSGGGGAATGTPPPPGPHALSLVPTVSCPPGAIVLCSRDYDPVKLPALAATAVPAGEAPVTTPILVSGIHRASLLHQKPVVDASAEADAAVAAAAAAVGGDSSAGGDALADLPTLRMDHCWDSFIYVLAPVSFATILGCSHCTIVVSAVAGSLLIEHCESVRVVAAAASVRISNSVDCVLHLHTPARPLISGDCRGLLFAPHNAPHATLAANMRRCGLLGTGEASATDTDATTGVEAFARLPANLWDSPMVLSSSTSQPRAAASDDGGGGGGASPSRAAGAGAGSDARGCFKLLPAAAFCMLTVPTVGAAAAAAESESDGDRKIAAALQFGEDAGGSGGSPSGGGGGSSQAHGAPSASAAASASAQAGLPLPMPAPYAEAVSRRHALVRSLRRSIRSEALTPDQRRELQYAVQAHFREWLVTSGSIRQVTDLVRVFRDKGAHPHPHGAGQHAHPLLHHRRRSSSSSSLLSAAGFASSSAVAAVKSASVHSASSGSSGYSAAAAAQSPSTPPPAGASEH